MPEQIDHNFLDALLSYFLRKDNRFVKVDDLSAEHKNAIKAAVQSKIEAYTQTLPPPEEEDKPEPPKKNAIQSLFSKFQKKS